MIVVVTDRRQLDRQISGTFERCGFPAPEQATSTRGLRRLLTSAGSRTVMTTIQKFEDALETPSGRLDVLNASEHVVVMVGRGAPHAVRDAGRADVEGAAEGGANRIHGHADRQGVRSQHDGSGSVR